MLCYQGEGTEKIIDKKTKNDDYIIDGVGI